MLKKAYDEGNQAALGLFGIKEAGLGGFLGGGAKMLAQQYFGQPFTAAKQLAAGTIRKPGGLWHGALWPSIPKNGPWYGKVAPWLQRAGTAYTGYQMLDAARGTGGDPMEGRLSNMLSAAGQGLGMAYGMPVGGLIGANLATQAGSSLGKHLGRALGSSPDLCSCRSRFNPYASPSPSQ